MGPATYMFLVKILFTQNVYPEWVEEAEKMGLLTFEKYLKNYWVIGETMEDCLAQARAIGNGYTRDHCKYLQSCFVGGEESPIARVSVDYEITSIENLGDADPEMPVFIIKKPQ